MAEKHETRGRKPQYLIPRADVQRILCGGLPEDRTESVFTVPELEELLSGKVSRETIYGWIRDGRIALAGPDSRGGR